MDLQKLEPHIDNRGTLVEAFRLPTDGQIFYVIIKPNEMRGSHYHMHKVETFLVLYGSAVIKVKDRDTDDIMNVEVSGYKPITVTIHPNHTHSVTATDEGAILLVWANEVFNEGDPDTYQEEI